MNNPLSDKILFLQVKNKDKEAFGKFYDLYATRIYRFIFFKVNTEHDAQDLTSEVFLKLWQSIKSDAEIKNLNSYVYGIARNTIIDFYRSGIKKEDSIDKEKYIDLPDMRKNQLQEQIKDSDLTNVLVNLKELKDEYKEVIVFRFLDEMSIGEIADIIKKSKGATRVLIHRALKALKKNIKDG